MSYRHGRHETVKKAQNVSHTNATCLGKVHKAQEESWSATWRDRAGSSSLSWEQAMQGIYRHGRKKKKLNCQEQAKSACTPGRREILSLSSRIMGKANTGQAEQVESNTIKMGQVGRKGLARPPALVCVACAAATGHRERWSGSF